MGRSDSTRNDRTTADVILRLDIARRIPLLLLSLVLLWRSLVRLVVGLISSLRLVILRVFREPHCDSFARVLKAESLDAILCILRTHFVGVVHKSDPLPIFVACKPNFVEARTALEEGVELVLGDVLRNVAYVETDAGLALTWWHIVRWRLER